MSGICSGNDEPPIALPGQCLIPSDLEKELLTRERPSQLCSLGLLNRPIRLKIYIEILSLLRHFPVIGDNCPDRGVVESPNGNWNLINEFVTRNGRNWDTRVVIQYVNGPASYTGILGYGVFSQDIDG